MAKFITKLIQLGLYDHIIDGLAKSREGWKIIDYQVVQTIRRGEIVDPTQNMKASFSSDG